MVGMASKALALLGFYKIESGGGSGVTPLICLPLKRPCLPKNGHGGPEIRRRSRQRMTIMELSSYESDKFFSDDVENKKSDQFLY